jgi:uroporphyrinogen decarboxylase
VNSFERIQATIEGRTTDRRAIAPLLSLYGARLTGCQLSEYYTNPAAYARGQAAVHEVFRPDVLFGSFALALLGGSFGSQLRFFADQPPNIGAPVIKSIDEWKQLRWPDFATDPGLNYLRETVRLIRKLNPDIPIAAMLPAPTEFAALIMGMEQWLDAVLFDTNRARVVVQEIIPFFVRLANDLFSAGTSFIIMPCAFALPSIVTRDIVTTFTRPALITAFAQLRGPVVVHHIGGEVLANLDLLKDLPAVAAYAIDIRDDIIKARAIIGSGGVLLCGPSGPNLYRMTATQVENNCRSLLESCRSDPRVILYTSGADIPLTTPVGNIHALRKAVEPAVGTND